MALVRNLLFALFTPWGRLAQLPFAVMAMVLVAANVAAQYYLSLNIEDLPAYNPLSIAQIVSLWMMFSILSRRFHDSGNAALFLVPYFAMTFAAYLFALDNAKLATSPFEEDHDTAAWFERVRMIYQLIGFGLIIWALKDTGDDGLNPYGPEFHIGAQKGQKPRRTMIEAVPSRAPMPETTVTEPPRSEPQRTFEPRRGRITPATSASRQGFGRR